MKITPQHGSDLPVQLDADGDTAYGVVHMLLRLAGLNAPVREELVVMAARVGELFAVEL